jgi:hypothetical protein
MKVVTASQPVSKPSYIHLAYVSAETAATFLLSAGVVLGLVILFKGAVSVWRNRTTKKRNLKTSIPPQTAEKADS